MNHADLTVPVRFDFGGTINFQAGLVRRAPVWMRHFGLEWAWRIKEEPYLWKRYWIDGCSLIWLCFRHVVPLLVAIQLDRRRKPHALGIASHVESARAVVKLSGDAIAANVHVATVFFRKVMAYEKDVVFDLSDVSNLDQRFIGLLLMLRKSLKSRGLNLQFTGVKKRIDSRFRLNGFAFLLEGRPA
jgi:N-acetylglucosaminyldiphosphoundecaprenol N-acetyl-beta-D-mannosaminyltransferase